MHSIAFITTLAQAATTQRDNVRLQISDKLRKLRMLILCPAGLINNWVEEFTKWNKHRVGVGAPWTISAQTTRTQRLRILEEWYSSAPGSVLIMGYELFRSWALNDSNGRRAPPFTEQEHEQVTRKLLRGPSLVIADEAHKLKSNDSKITKAARLLKTKSRVALTGSPLSNNLKEYYAMVDWISPGYLGDFIEFKANFVEVIELGLFKDCTPWQRRKARVKLAALIEILEPKIHRREIDALQKELPPRTQFVLTVPLPALMFKIYESFIKHALGGITESTSNASLWGLITYLSLLCSHPYLFEEATRTARRKLEAKAESEKAKRAKSPIKRIRQLQDEVSVWSL